jgi:hypothetical protein
MKAITALFMIALSYPASAQAPLRDVYGNIPRDKGEVNRSVESRTPMVNRARGGPPQAVYVVRVPRPARMLRLRRR